VQDSSAFAMSRRGRLSLGAVSGNIPLGPANGMRRRGITPNFFYLFR
jgi:hypothetical protein